MTRKQGKQQLVRPFLIKFEEGVPENIKKNIFPLYMTRKIIEKNEHLYTTV